jgi:hypothetical protein
MDKQNALNIQYSYTKKYKNLRFGKPADGAYYVGCQRWFIKSAIPLINDQNIKKN